MEDKTTTKGQIELEFKYADGHTETRVIKNTVLAAGRNALAQSLANSYGSSYLFYISQIVFGSGGVDGTDTPKYVDSNRTDLYNTIISKPISSVVDPVRPNEVVFTAVLAFDDPSFDISEAGLRMGTGDLYSMTTFGKITKTNLVQLTWNWRISFV